MKIFNRFSGCSKLVIFPSMSRNRFFWRNVGLVFVVMLASFGIGYKSPMYPSMMKIVLILVVAFLVGLRWGAFGLFCLVIAFAPLEWPGFNVSRIPVFGWGLSWASLRERTILFLGGGYLIALLMKTLHDRVPWRGGVMPFLPLGFVAVAGYLVAVVFAWFPGESELIWFSRTILSGIIVFLLVYSLARTPAMIETVCLCIAISGAIFAVIVLFAPSSMVSYEAVNTSYLVLGRISGTWMLPLGMKIEADSVYISTYLALSIVIAWGKVLTSQKRSLRWLLLALIALMARVLFMAGGRTGIYGSAIGVAVLTVLYYSKILVGKRKKAYGGSGSIHMGIRGLELLVLFCLVIIIAVWQFSAFLKSLSDPNYIWERIFYPISGVDQNAIGRVRLFMASLNQSLSYPLGPGSGALHSATGYNNHSLYPLLLAGLGWFGFAFFFWLLIWCIQQLVRGLKHSEPAIRDSSMVLLGGTVIVIAMGFGHPIVGTTWGVILFWTLLGLAAALNRILMTW